MTKQFILNNIKSKSYSAEQLELSTDYAIRVVDSMQIGNVVTIGKNAIKRIK